MSNDGTRPTTTDAGIPVASDEHSLTIGPDGPIVLHDHYLLEQMANFNRERIPERQPHAKGSGAFGRFEVTQDVRQYTRAAVFQPGDRLVSNVVGHLKDGVSEPVLERAFEYWRNIDREVGDRIAKGVRGS